MFQRIFFSAVMAGAFVFAAFGLAPALGLPPELPGAFAASLRERQLWWLLAASGAAAGLLLLAFKRGAAFKALAEQFALVSSPFWIVPGLCAGYFFNRLGRE